MAKYRIDATEDVREYVSYYVEAGTLEQAKESVLSGRCVLREVQEGEILNRTIEEAEELT
jgi:hypothetical protein